MTTIASRDLRNHTARVLAEVAEGGRVTVTTHGRPVAEIRPLSESRPTFVGRAEFLRRLVQADAGLRDDLDVLAGDTTDDLGEIR